MKKILTILAFTLLITGFISSNAFATSSDNNFNKKICRFCCDKYQLSDESISECLKCDYLFREVGCEVRVNKGIMIMYEYKDKFIFDNNNETFNIILDWTKLILWINGN